MTARARTLVPSLLLTAAALTASGCAGGSATAGANPFRGASGEEEITIEVQNLNFNDATLWAMTPGGQHRLGVVSGKSDRTFTMDWGRAQQFSVRIRLQGGRECQTRTITTDPGDTFQLTIDVNFGQTRYCG